MDLQTAFDRGFEAVKAYVDAELGRFAARLAEIEARPIEKGDPGPPGNAGQPGERGEKGDTGRDGRDAADIGVLKGFIAEQVMSAFEQVSFTSADLGRTLNVEFGGKSHSIKTAIPIHVGLWKENTTYLAGDGVTHGGQFFIAQGNTTAKPLTSNEWRLVVQRGRDGRDWRPDEKRVAEPVRFK